MPEAPEAASPAVLLLELGHRARLAASLPELEFLLVNDTRLLAPYRQAALWREAGGVAALSGVVQPDRNAPYAQWLARACAHLARADGDTARAVSAADLPDELGAQWREWLPPQGVWLPLRMLEEPDARPAGGLLLAGADPVAPTLLPLLTEWSRIWCHAWRALQRARPWSWDAWRNRARSRPAAAGRGWRRPGLWAACALLAAGAIPVRLSVLAPGELVAAQPAVLRAPLDGVVAQIHVQPNQIVKQGQPLFSLDEAQIASRLQVAQQALSTAEAEYRQFAQMALGDPRSKAQLAALAGKIGERRAEQAFLAEQLGRASVTAPRDGMVLFDSPSEWIGKPVQTGERVMRVADPDAVEIEAWVPVGDAIPLAEGAPLRLYLAADPLTAVQGRVRYMAYDAVARPDGSYAYRVRASLDQAQGPRIGLKGTAKLQGERVPLAYWILRKPWAAIRQFVAL